MSRGHYLETDLFYNAVLDAAERGGFVVALVDLDNFNYVNDLFGFETGDRVLKKMTEHFDRLLADEERFSRLHADHYTFLLRDGDGKTPQRLSEMMESVGNLDRLLLRHYRLSACGGIVRLEPGDQIRNVLDATNFARKEAKTHGSNQFLYYDQNMRNALEWRKIVTLGAENAINNGEFVMYLQPKISMADKKIVGSEALARWIHPTYGMIAPDRFIPVFEKSGFVRALDFHMLHEVCAFLKESKERGLPMLPISVNFSKQHLGDEDFIDHVARTVEQKGIEPKLIELEMTENIFTEEVKRVVEISSELKRRGFRVSLDDFGRAYSSLTYLKDIPLDIIKIDKGFLDETDGVEKGRVIIAKMVELIRSLHMTSVMEGVETAEQVKFLEDLGCDVVQGFYYARPMPKEEFVQRLVGDGALNENRTPVGGASDAAFVGQKAPDNAALMELERKISELKISNERFRRVAALSNDILFEWDFKTDNALFTDKKEQFFTKHWTRKNFSGNEEVRKRIYPADLEAFEAWIGKVFKRRGEVEAEYRIRRFDGKFVWMKVKSMGSASSDDGEADLCIGVMIDIDQQKNEIDYLLEKTKIDPLTRLLNKEETRRRIENELAVTTARGGAFVIVDIDNFKGVNDNLGHQFGDGVLKEFSKRIATAVGRDDVVGRLGGDEIVVYFKGAGDEKTAALRVDDLLNAVRGAYFGTSAKYDIAASAGISLNPSDSTSYEELYFFADIALYESKRKGKDCYTFYNAGLEKTATLRTPVDWSERFLANYFEGDIVYNVFEQLYETRDLETSVNTVMAMLGAKFRADRVCVFELSADRKTMSNTFVWTKDGIDSDQEKLQHLNITKLEPFFESFGKDGILCRNDIADMDPYAFQVLRSQGIQSLLLSAIVDDGKVTGFVGFDTHYKKRIWNAEEIAILGYISRILSIFLLKRRAISKCNEVTKNLEEVLDGLGELIYVADTQSKRLLYVNDAACGQRSEPEKKCYERLFYRKTPCENCPLAALAAGKNTAESEIYVEKFGRKMRARAARINWSDGTNAALIAMSEIPTETVRSVEETDR